MDKNMPIHADIKENHVVEYSKKYDIKETIINNDYQRCINNSRKIYNFTSITELLVYDGSTGKIVSIPANNKPSDTNSVIIDCIFELYSYTDFINKNDSIKKRVTRYIVSEDELRERPVYIPELNIIVSTKEWSDIVSIPNPKRELELQKEDTKRIIKSMMNHLAVQIFVTIPKRYNGAKTFYTIINGTVVTLPIITSIEYTEDITLTIRMYNGISQYMDEFIFPLEPKKLFDGITFSTDNYQWYVGTNPVNIQKKFYENEHKHLSSEMELRRKEENFKLEKEKLKRENEILKGELDNSKATITQMNSALKTAKEVSSDSKETVLNYLKLGATIIVVAKTLWPIIKIVLDKK